MKNKIEDVAHFIYFIFASTTTWQLIFLIIVILWAIFSEPSVVTIKRDMVSYSSRQYQNAWLQHEELEELCDPE